MILRFPKSFQSKFPFAYRRINYKYKKSSKVYENFYLEVIIRFKHENKSISIPKLIPEIFHGPQIEVCKNSD